MDETAVSLVYLVRRPRTTGSGKPPILLLLHGYGSNEHDLFSLGDYLDDRFLIVSIRAPLTLSAGAYAWYALDFTINGIDFDPADAVNACEVAGQALDEVVAAYDADPEHVIVMGFSQGAAVSLGLALRHPDKVAGVGVLSGHLMPDLLEREPPHDALAGMPIFVAHGKWDDVLPIEQGRQIEKFLSRYLVNLEYHEYPMAHQISPESLTDIARWLIRQLESDNR